MDYKEIYEKNRVAKEKAHEYLQAVSELLEVTDGVETTRVSLLGNATIMVDDILRKKLEEETGVKQ